MNHYFESVQKKIQEFFEANKPAIKTETGGSSQTGTGGSGGSAVSETNPMHYRCTLKRHITTKADLMAIINQLQQHIDKLDNGSSIDLELND